MSEVVRVGNLSVAFTSEERQVAAVRNISFSIHAGELFALVGESGSGKSVTAHALLRLLPHEARIQADEIEVAGTNLSLADDPALRALRGGRVGMIFQEPMTALNPLHTVERQVGEAIAIHQSMPPAALRSRVLELLRRVALPDPESKLENYPHELSGGQRQRVMIAMALANDPVLLIADEPTTALDVTVQAQILDLILQLKRESGMAVLLITHDLNLVRRHADRVAVMKEGELVELANATDLFRAPGHPYTQKLLAAEPAGAPRMISTAAPVLLEVEDLRVWFPVKRGLFRRTVDHIKAVTDVSFSLREGQTLGIVGESGSGKSTTAFAILRLLSAEGSIRVRGRDWLPLHERELRPLRREVQVVFQDPYGSLSPRMTIADIVSEGLRLYGQLDSADLDIRVCEALTEVGLDPSSRHRYPHEFSGGQRQRIAIARALVIKPAILILDEPTSALDRSVQTQIIDLLRDLQLRHALSYLFISHDLRTVRALAHKILVMKGGRVIESGDADRVFDAPESAYTRELIAAAFL